MKQDKKTVQQISVAWVANASTMPSSILDAVYALVTSSSTDAANMQSVFEDFMQRFLSSDSFCLEKPLRVTFKPASAKRSPASAFLNLIEHTPGMYGDKFDVNYQSYEVACKVVLQLSNPNCKLQRDSTVDGGVGLVRPNTTETCDFWLYLRDVTYLRKVSKWQRMWLNTSFYLVKNGESLLTPPPPQSNCA